MGSKVRLFGGLAAALSGAGLYTLASPPWELAALAWLVPALLLIPASSLSPGRAALLGLSFGLGIAAGITNWAFHASLQYFEFNRAMAAAFVGLVWVLYAGLPYALLTAAYSLLVRRTPALLHPLVAAWLWVLLEMARSLPTVGMPWGLLSHTQWQNLPLIQIADLGGAYAVTFVVVFTSVSLGLAVSAPPLSRPGGHRLAIRIVPVAALLVLVWVYGVTTRVAHATTTTSTKVAVVQGNIQNTFRWKRAFFERMVLTYLRLTSRIEPSPGSADLIVWPENAVSFYPESEPMMFRPIRQLAMRTGASLLVGAPRLEDSSIARNSAFLIDPRGRIADSYDKRLLVPFAETSVFPIAAAASGEPRYAGGSGRARPLSGPGFEIGTVICFEVLFPHLVRQTVLRGANLLVNISNDSWMDAGDGAAPRQHFAMAVLRAVEMRRALVRASSGGVSGFVRSTGEVHGTVPWGEAGPALGEVGLTSTLTPYARYGELWVLVLTGGLVAAIVLGRDRRGPS